MLPTKEILALYLRAAASEDGSISSSADAATLNQKLDTWDIVTFEALLVRRSEKLRDMATGKIPRGLFDARSYASQADTIDGIIKLLPTILASK